MDNLIIRHACLEDLPKIVEIYNHYILHSAATFDIEPIIVEDKIEWFKGYQEDSIYQLLIASYKNSIVGYASNSPFNIRAAYSSSCEVSIYINKSFTGKNIATRLYKTLFTRLHSKNIHRFYAGITIPNLVSIQLHERFDFKKVAHYHEVGFKFGKFWDVIWLEKHFKEPQLR